MAKIPENIGPYKISSSLGKGGTSQVYRAVHPTLKKTVVLKKLTLGRGVTLQERFRREADLMMSLNHPNIVKVFDLFKEGRSWVIVQEYVEGLNLDQLIHLKGRLSPHLASWIIHQCAKALHYIHKKGIIHRDIKPSNIFISKEGAVKLGDFGIAARVDDSQGLTREGAALGTPDYMPPEQVLDPSSVDQRADIYSLGMTYYEAMTGSRFERSPRLIFPLMLSFRGRTVERALRKRPFFRYATLRPMKLRLRLSCWGSPRRNQKTLERCMFTGRSEKGEPHRPFRFNASRFLLYPLLGLTILMGSIYLVRNVLLAGNYGLVQLQLSLPEESPQWLVESPEATLYRQHGHSLNRGRRVALPVNRRDGNLQSRRLYIPSGYYRMEISRLDGLEWTSFYLPSRREQRLNGVELLVLHSVVPAMDARPLDLTLTVRDCFTGEPLPFQGDIWLGEERWESLQSLSGRLFTDESYTIRVAAEGYQPFYQTQYFGINQQQAPMDIALVPEGGKLYLEGEPQGIRFELDGKKQYLSLEGAPQIRRIVVSEEPLIITREVHLLQLTYQGMEYPIEIDFQGSEAQWVSWENHASGGLNIHLNGIPLSFP